MKENSPIGFFDSGVGGLSVYSRFRKLFPAEDTLYFGDLKNLPYGNKTKEELIGFARNILDFFKTQNVKAVVIACNTSSALAYDTVKDEYDFKIFPIIQSCAKVLAGLDVKRIGVFATPATVASGAYSREINRYNPLIQVKEIACPNWVSIVEGRSSEIKDVEMHLKEMLEFKPDKIILGCTHYPYLINELTKFAPKEIFIDPAEIFVDYISSNLEIKTTGIGSEEFFVSAKPEEFKKNSKLFYNVSSLKTLAPLR